MVAGDELEAFHCVCSARVLRANNIGIEQYCAKCKRRWLIPYSQHRNKEALFRYLDAWRARERSR